MRFGYMEAWSPRDARLYRIDEAADHLADPDEYRDRVFLRYAVAHVAGYQLAVAASYDSRHRPDRFRHSGAQSVVRARGRPEDAPHGRSSAALGSFGRGSRPGVRYRALGGRFHGVVA